MLFLILSLVSYAQDTTVIGPPPTAEEVRVEMELAKRMATDGRTYEDLGREDKALVDRVMKMLGRCVMVTARAEAIERNRAAVSMADGLLSATDPGLTQKEQQNVLLEIIVSAHDNLISIIDGTERYRLSSVDIDDTSRIDRIRAHAEEMRVALAAYIEDPNASNAKYLHAAAEADKQISALILRIESARFDEYLATPSGFTPEIDANYCAEMTATTD
ncbi:MAG: hypothetical protein O3B64_03590 [bacterium]|nr:hypothetical protein [bacterium]